MKRIVIEISDERYEALWQELKKQTRPPRPGPEPGQMITDLRFPSVEAWVAATVDSQIGQYVPPVPDEETQAIMRQMDVLAEQARARMRTVSIVAEEVAVQPPQK